jgi:predicted  nucleic acid-binding Zn-ribbon protein
MSGETIVGIVFFFMLFGGGGMIFKIIESAQRTRVELAKLQTQQKGTENVGHDLTLVREELAALRQQIDDLRDTSTQYDLSFDTALQRMERRVEHLEQQQNRIGA